MSIVFFDFNRLNSRFVNAIIIKNESNRIIKFAKKLKLIHGIRDKLCDIK